MKKQLQVKLLLTILVAAMSFYSLSMNADIQGKKKAKEKTSQKQPTVEEDYGNTVSLVTSGSGATVDEATRNALRNALEQAYGTFVSANTTVVNDELVSDAISTVSSGNVVGYEQISCINIPEGYQVSIKSVVSIGGLVAFASNHGMTTELAGNTFLLNRNLARLNKENEKKAFINLISQLHIIIQKGIFDYSVDVGQPKGNTTLAIDVKVKATPNDNYDLFWDTIDKTLSSLSMSPTESNNYKQLGMNTYSYGYIPSNDGYFNIYSKTDLSGMKSRYILRNNIGKPSNGSGTNDFVLCDNKTEFNLLQTIQFFLKAALYSFEVYDNIGIVLTPMIRKSKANDDVSSTISSYGMGTVENRIIYSFILKNTGTNTNTQVWRKSNSYSSEIFGCSFEMLYSESKLNQLRNISVRPHSIDWVK